MAEKEYKTVCRMGKDSKTYHTTGETLQEARDKAMISAIGDGYSEATCKTSEA
ncbi:MAG TPA: hypothetical protein PKA33_20545 [Amaricoccus sp.]|uniref:hypothetical protein n=1 Tax=Amaricoccus sp. TaxID=1872485 RepID=UPI002B5DE708|nr:hypothetical protein [Amaricoccus sp.]HMQ94482.1 hypothetical protein [Amaricoccus sp.]HMR54679.1 hypothetical protein [Amaricoccus sp.]HMR61574.1 hypothetical protein [Amaricoccus sp.]HMU01722.1 hypothetical protein [Amaricoccus sp.]